MTRGGAPAPPGDGPGSPGVPGLVADLFRRSSARLVSSLTGALGAQNLHLAEECVQDALVRALQTWPFRGIPEDPESWLFAVARNRALDRIRRGARWEADPGGGSAAELTGALERLAPPVAPPTAPHAAGSLADDELAMVLMCCHPALRPDARVALTLKVVGGLSVEEIAAAFLAEPATVAQRIVRAKRTLREKDVGFEIPDPDRITERLEVVLRVVYLLFSEGYAAHEGDAVVRRELCEEALRLGRILAAHPVTTGPAVDALVALMLLQSSRLPARSDADGHVLLLEEQDRALWDRHRIQEGMVYLDRAGRGPSLTAYHLEAGIAAVHAVAPSFDDTDWGRILAYYDLLRDVAPSPVVEVNRAVAVSMVEGPEAGLAALAACEPDGALRRYALLPAVRGTLLARAGRGEEATVHLRRAIMVAPSAAGRRLLERRLAAVAEGSPPHASAPPAPSVRPARP